MFLNVPSDLPQKTLVNEVAELTVLRNRMQQMERENTRLENDTRWSCCVDYIVRFDFV